MNLSDDAIAAILANQASKPRSMTDISRHYTSIASHQSEPVTVNKTFLDQTIRNVESHNRREEKDSCWRTHLLQKQIGRKRGRDASEECDQRFEDDRSEWAKKKLQAFAGVEEVPFHYSCSGESDSKDEDKREKKRHKKNKKKAKKRSKEEKKDKKERKKCDKKEKKKKKKRDSDDDRS